VAIRLFLRYVASFRNMSALKATGWSKIEAFSHFHQPFEGRSAARDQTAELKSLKFQFGQHEPDSDFQR